MIGKIQPLVAKCKFVAALSLLAGLLVSAHVSAELRLLASIKPLALIAQELAGEQVTVDTLLPITASPHDYPLKMSDHKRLASADLVLWVGPELESFLAKSLRQKAPQQVLSAYELADIHWPEQGVAEDEHEADERDHHDHEHHGKDPHLWLNPQNAAVIAQSLAQRLSELLPEDRAIFAARAQAFAQKMQLLDSQLSQNLAPVKAQGFAVYHEGYSHFVSHYGLNQLAYIRFTPERRPGAKHLMELHRVLQQQGVCLFSEPYQQAPELASLAQELGLRSGQLDPIGSATTQSYSALITAMSQAFLTCLADRVQH